MRKKFLLILIFSFCLLAICSCSNECNGEHDYDDGEIISSPTCTTDGKMLYTCKNCKKKLTKTISSLGHEKEEEWTSDDMYHYHLCKNCHEYKFDEAAHEYDDSKTCICGNKKEHNLYQKPTAINTIFSYTGEDIVFIPSGFDENIMSITGNIQKECGTYFVIISLKDKVNSMWSDLTTDDVIISYQITLDKVVLNIPQKSSLTYTYTGQSITYLPQGFDSSIMSITGNNKINAGEYEVIVKIKDSSKYEFENGSNEVKYQFIIEKVQLLKPTIIQTNNYYTGNDITVKLNNFDESVMDIMGNTKKEVGNYEVEISLKDNTNYEWDDETIQNITLYWEIIEQELLYKITSIDSNTIKINYSSNDETSEMIIELPCNSSYKLNQETGEITFTYSLESSEAIVYNFTGNYYGSITFNINEETSLEIELDNFTLTSYLNCPLYIESANEVDISSKKNTENFIYDNREEESLKGAIYSTCDLKIKGTGFLSVNSKNNNGIHSKDDLKIQKVTLYINSVDNCLKGNDEVKISSGILTLISRKGDGIKTSNTSLSKKNNQKGDVIIDDGTINIYSACNGIDAAHSIIINGGNININTDKFSEYSEEVTKVNNNCYYIRSTSNYYSYSIYYYNTLEDGVWANSNGITKTVNAGRDKYYYYEINRPEGYSYLKVYIYNSSQTQGQSSNYYKVSSQLSINNNYDTIAYGSNRPGGSSSFSWTTYETVPSMGPGGGMGPGGMQEGNPNKGDYSTKGLKSDNEITINDGVINIKSYDDCIHTNNDVTLESGNIPTGNIIINNGILNLYSNDDGIHGDGIVTINNGTIDVVNSYEGIEGINVIINGGNISVLSSDDGVNATSTSGIGIEINGGIIYIFAGGDGVDSNSQSSYEGILFSGGKSVIISYGRSDSSIDTERGYKYTGGCVIGIGMSGGMSSESTHCNNFSSIGLSKTISLSKDNYLCLSDVATIKIPYTMNALVVVLGNNETDITTSSSSSLTFDKNGISYLN